MDLQLNFLRMVKFERVEWRLKTEQQGREESARNTQGRLVRKDKDIGKEGISLLRQ